MIQIEFWEGDNDIKIIKIWSMAGLRDQKKTRMMKIKAENETKDEK